MLAEDVPVDRGEESGAVGREVAGQPGTQREQHARPDDVVAEVLSADRPGRRLHQVPEHDAQGQDQGGEEAAAGGLVPAPEHGRRVDHQHHRHRPDHHPAQHRVQVGAAQVAGVERGELRDIVHVRELRGALAAELLRARARAVAGHRGPGHGVDDRGDDDTGHTEDAELAESIETTELHDDRGDDIVRPGFLRAVLQVPHRQFRSTVPADEQPGADEDDEADDGGGDDGELRPVLTFPQVQTRLVADDEHEEDGDHELDHEVGQGHVGGSEGQHDPGHRRAGDTDQDHRAEPGAGGDDRDDHEQHHRQAREVAELVDAVDPGRQAAELVQALFVEEGGAGEQQHHREDPDEVAVRVERVARPVGQASPPVGELDRQ